MGCGKSKHAVATADTLAKSKSRSKSLEKTPPVVEDHAKSDAADHVTVNEAKNPADHGKVKDDHQIKKKETDHQKAEEGKGKKDGKDKENDGDHGNGESAAAAAVVVVEENKNGELKGSGKEEKVKKEVEVAVDHHQEDQEKLLLVSHDSSPKDFFSPEKEHGETIESIITDAVSGKSDYYSPRAKGNDAVEGKGVDGEANSNKGKEEALKVDEGEKVAPADETKASGEEKTPVPAPAADNESANAASTTVAKAD